MVVVSEASASALSPGTVQSTGMVVVVVLVVVDVEEVLVVEDAGMDVVESAATSSSSPVQLITKIAAPRMAMMATSTAKIWRGCTP